MEATAPRVPWWYFALAGLVMAAALGILNVYGFGWPIKIAAILIIQLGLLAVVFSRR